MDTKPLKLTLAIATLAVCGAAFSGAVFADTPLPQTARVDTVGAIDPAATPVPDTALQLLAPGTYDWHPELSPTGDVLLVVSLPQQQLHVYRGGVRIGRSTISSGKPGHETTTGVFTILQKKVAHRSNLYNDAPMPYMQRLTWDGIALHAGNLPGYAASHGCIRLPLEFSKLLYGATTHDTVVIVADYDSFAADVVAPGDIVSADMLAAVTAEGEPGLAQFSDADASGADAGTAEDCATGSTIENAAP